MVRLRDNYTRYPRPILWLVRGGVLGERTVEPFYLSKRPVTNVQFEAHAPDFERSPLALEDDDPATGLTFDEAGGYCAWYAEVSRKPMRLPTEIEWEYACGPAREPAGTYVNPFGLLDMLGGVREFSVKPDGTGVLWGGSASTPDSERHPAARREVGPATRIEDAGFRVARGLQ